MGVAVREMIRSVLPEHLKPYAGSVLNGFIVGMFAGIALGLLLVALPYRLVAGDKLSGALAWLVVGFMIIGAVLGAVIAVRRAEGRDSARR